MTGPAGHLQMELCSPNREMCRQQNLVPAFVKSPQVLMTFLRGEERTPTPDKNRPVFHESSAKLSNNEHRENSLCKGERRKPKSTYYIILGSFPFLPGYSAQQNCVLGCLSCKLRLWGATGHLPRQGRRDNHGTWPTPAPGAPAQPGSQRTAGEACLRDSRRQSLGAATSKKVMKTQQTTLSPHPGLISVAIN